MSAPPQSSLRLASCGLALALCCAGPGSAWGAGDCKFPPGKPVILKNMGPCNFDLNSLSFAGDPVQQARCLITPVLKFGKLGAPLETLPAALADYVGRSTGLLEGDALRRLAQLVSERGLEKEFAATLSQPVSHAQKDDFVARSASYFVIHDTSSPNFMGRAWPGDIDRDAGINKLERYACANKIERAHVFINRSGAILIGHDFEIPWRATKFEMAVEFNTRLRGLFLHIELIQPRRREPGRGWANDFQAPNPGFSQAQYDALALVYAVASMRAGKWLIPAFHAVIDEGIWDKHDDPQNFDLAAFADSLTKLRARLAPTAIGQSQ